MSVQSTPRRLAKDGLPSSPITLLSATRQQLINEVKRLLRQLAKWQKQAGDSDEKLAEAQQRIAELEKKIADLEQRLALRDKDSTNSSKPPSSDGLRGGKRQYPRRKKGRRKPGGQAGHAGKHRPLLPSEQVQEIVVLLPPECKHCGEKLPQDPEKLETEGTLHRHQVTELPPIQPFVTEYQNPKVVCPGCRRGTRQPLPKELASHFGPQLSALIAYLTVLYRIPRRGVESLLQTVLGISISLGSTHKQVEQASDALQAPYEELEQQLASEPVLNGDETGWKNNGQRRWLWVLVANSFAFYTVAKTRSSQVLLQLLGSTFAGILCSDRYGAYRKYHKGTAQWCWAHLKRDLLGIQQFVRSTDAGRFSRDALAVYARLFRLWHRFCGNSLDRTQLQDKSVPLQKQFFALCQRYMDSQDRKVRVLASALFNQCDRLFTFILYPGVAPTNNISERALRRAVQWRKICFGNRSSKGEVATARLLTVCETCAMQKRNALEFLAQAIQCYRSGKPIPSLLSK